MNTTQTKFTAQNIDASPLSQKLQPRASEIIAISTPVDVASISAVNIKSSVIVVLLLDTAAGRFRIRTRRGGARHRA